MSDDLSNRSVLVVDDGQFIELAIRLAREFGKVYFWNPSLIEGFPKAPKSFIGNGFEEVTWVRDLWPVKDKVDLFVFPDIGQAGLQLELESQGKRVIGSRNGDRLEINRIAFKKIQERLGLNVPKHTIIRGVSNLFEHLNKVEDKWIKIDRYRGTMETQHHINIKLSMGWLLKLWYDLGPLAEDIDFLVEDPIRGSVEIGYDGFFFGEFPTETLFGPEIKSKSYIGAVVKYPDLDERIRSVNEALSSELRAAGYRNFFSTEIRIAEDDENFEDGQPVLIEPTCRIPSPPFESELETYGNLGKMLWHGSVGEVIEPEMTAEFSVACRFNHDDQPDGWRAFEIPEHIRRWVKVYDAFKKDGLYNVVPKEPHANRIGCFVGNGSTIEEALEECKQVRTEMKDQPLSSEFDSLADAIKEIEHAEKQGMEFAANGEVPQPAIVLE